MFRKIVFASIVAVLILSGSISPSLAQGVVPNKPAPPPTTFVVAVNPTQSGFTSDQAFGNAPIKFKKYLYDFVPEDIFNSSMALKYLRSTDGINWEYAGMPYPEDPRYNFILGGTVYKGHLYIALNKNNCVSDTNTIPGLVLRTANGTDWEKVFQAPGTDGATTQTGRLGSFKGWLYVTTVVGHADTGNAQIWRSRTGNDGTWELATDVFGNNTHYTSVLVPFKKYAYITATDADGVHIWRSADGANWDQVGQDLLSDPAYTNWYATTPVVFHGALFVGTNPMVFAFNNAADYTGGQLYRSRDGMTWEMVVAHGFGASQYPSGIDGLIVYRNQLFALSNDMAPDGSTGQTYVWRSKTGKLGEWEPVNADGMGPNSCVGFSWEAVFNNILYIGNGWGLGNTTDLMKMVNP